LVAHLDRIGLEAGGVFCCAFVCILSEGVNENGVCVDGCFRAYVCDWVRWRIDWTARAKAATQATSLAKHRATHKVGERALSLKCTHADCSYVASQLSHLKVHARSHVGGDKPFGCEWEGCTYRTALNGNLKTHFRTHTGERPFVAPNLLRFLHVGACLCLMPDVSCGVWCLF
jgi:hypothetical protein